jgi:hypothetical protein
MLKRYTIMSSRTASRILIIAITLFTIMTTLIPLIPSNAETENNKPSWAKPGVTLAYSWDLLEYQPIEEIDQLIAMYEKYPGGTSEFIFTLSSVNETHGVFQAVFPRSNQTGEMICKWNGSPCLIGPVGNASSPFIALYKPPQTLKDYPLVLAGNLQAFKVEENITEPGASPKRIISYYHKDTGILVLYISISYIKESAIRNNTADVMKIQLLSTNAISARPYWAFPGIKLSYSIFILNVSTTNVNDVIMEIEKNFTYYASLEPAYTIEILDTDESIGVIREEFLYVNMSRIANYSWVTGVELFFDPASSILQGYYNDWYMPPDLLNDYPLVTLSVYQTHKVKSFRVSYYYHKDTGIKVLQILYWCSNVTSISCVFLIMALVSTNIAFPRVYTNEVVIEEERFVVVIVSNSNISGFNYSVNEVSFNVSGDPGSPGFCNVSIPKTLVKPGYTIKVYFDNNPINYKLSENSTHYFIYFTYNHSVHRVDIKFEPIETTSSPTQTPIAKPTLKDYTWPIIIVVILVAITVALFALLKRRK